MIKNYLSSKIKGINLLDVCVSMAVLTFGVLGTVLMLLNAKEIKQFADEDTLAALAASTKMEEILATDWENIPTYNNIPLDSFFVKGLALPDGSTAHGKIHIETDYEIFLHMITVTITWRSNYGNKSTTTITHCAKWL